MYCCFDSESPLAEIYFIKIFRQVQRYVCKGCKNTKLNKKEKNPFGHHCRGPF